MQTYTAPQKTLGNLADFKSGNTRSKEFIFVLNHVNQNPSFTSNRGVKMHYPPSVRIALVDSVYDKDKNMMREIRYIVGETSIYKDEQTADDKVSKSTYFVEFVNGEYMVQGTDTLKLKFLMLSNLNGSNPTRDKNRNIRYFMVDPGEGLQKVMDDDELLIEAQQFCYKGDWDEVAAYAMVLGIPLDRDTREIRYSLKMRATADPKRFLDGMKSPKMKRKYFVMEALNAGIIVRNYTTNSVNWKNGNAITQSPIGKDLIDDFVDATFTPAGETVYKTMLGILRPETQIKEVTVEVQNNLSPAAKKELVDYVTPKPKAEIILAEENDPELTELVKKAVSNGIIEFKKPMWYKYKGQVFKKESGVINALKGDATLVAHLKLDLSNI